MGNQNNDEKRNDKNNANKANRKYNKDKVNNEQVEFAADNELNDAEDALKQILNRKDQC